MFGTGWNFITWNLNTWEFTSYKNFVTYKSSVVAPRSLDNACDQCIVGASRVGGTVYDALYGVIHSVAWENGDLS
jgi:hypothetical protein